jgi:hypothetical protein
MLVNHGERANGRIRYAYQRLLVLGLHGLRYLAHVDGGCGRAAEGNENAPSTSNTSPSGDDNFLVMVECSDGPRTPCVVGGSMVRGESEVVSRVGRFGTTSESAKVDSSALLETSDGKAQ